jgi:hypothetical protein
MNNEITCTPDGKMIIKKNPDLSNEQIRHIKEIVEFFTENSLDKPSQIFLGTWVMIAENLNMW